jgi:hypothetical protein
VYANIVDVLAVDTALTAPATTTDTRTPVSPIDAAAAIVSKTVPPVALPTATAAPYTDERFFNFVVEQNPLDQDAGE